MTTKDTADEQVPEAQPAPAPAPEPAPSAEPSKEEKGSSEKPRSGLPVGHILLGGASATTLGGFWLASAVGPWAVAGVGATAVAGGAAYLHHRWSRKHGRSGHMARTVRTQTSRSGGGALGRMGLGGSRRGGGLGSSGSAGRSVSQRRSSSAGSVGTSGRRGGTASGAGAARPAGGRGSSARRSSGAGSSGRRMGGGRGSSGTAGRGGLLGRRQGGSGSSGRGLPGRGSGRSGRTSRKGMGRPHSTPPGDGGLSSPGSKRSRLRMGRGRATKRGERGGGAVGATPKTSPRQGASGRWGGASGTGASKPGRLRAMGRRLGGWADGRTGKRASTAWKAASGARGFRARRRAARDALRSRANHHRVATPAFAAFGAVAASLWAWGGRVRTAQHARAQRAMDNVDPDAHTTHEAHSGAGTPTADADTATAPTETPPAPEQPNTAAPAAPTASPSGPTVRSTTVAGLPHARAAGDMLSAAGRYEPDDAYTVVREAKEWPDVSRDVAMSVRAYAQRLEGARFPLDQACMAKLQEYYTALSRTVSLAEEIEPLLRKAHQTDLDRQDSPRGDESKWNV